MAKKTTEKNASRPAAEVPRSMPKGGKDPKGGLTAKGREYFNKKEGSHLRPGVQGPADTPEKMVRKGSFLRRHFTHPRGPMKDDKGEPTRLALSAHAWGEPVPDTPADAKKLASKGHQLLERYHQIKEAAEREPDAPRPGAKRAGRGAAGKTAGKAARTTAAKKTAGKKTTAQKTAAKKAEARKAGAKKAGAKRAPAKGSTGRSTSGRAIAKQVGR